MGTFSVFSGEKGECPLFLDSGIPGPDNFAPSW